VLASLPLPDARASALQFRYLFVTDAEGLECIDVTDPAQPRRVPQNTIRIADAHRSTWRVLRLCRRRGGRPDHRRRDPAESMRLVSKFNANGRLTDSRDVMIGSTNASLFAYVADGAGGSRSCS